MPEEKLIVSLSETGALTVKRDIDGIGNSAKSAGGMVQLLQRALGVIAVGMAIREYMKLADTFTRIQNTLRKFNDSETYLTTTTDALYRIAQQTRSGFESTVDTFERVAEATAEWGMTQKDALQITKSLNQAIILSGGSTESATMAIYQLTKGMAQGSINGMELRSILRDTEVVAEVLAKQLGVTKGQLRKMGDEGKISAEVILKAFKNAREELDEKFGKRIPTVTQAMSVLKNSLIEFVGTLDKNTGASGKFAQAVIFLSKHLRDMVTIVKTLTVTLLLLFSPQIINGALLLGTNLVASLTAIITASTTMSTTALPLAIVQVGKLTAAFKALWLVLAKNPLIILGALLIGGTVAAMDYFNKKMDEADRIQEEAHQKALSMIQAKRKEVVIHREAADAVKAYMTALKQENDVLRLNETQQEIQRALLKATEQAKRPLTEAEIKGVTNLVKEHQAIVKANDALKEREDFLKEIIGPAQEYAARVKMLDDFQKKGDITAAQYTKTLWDLKETYGQLGKEKPVDLVSSDWVTGIKQKVAFHGTQTDMQRENYLLKMGNQERKVQEALLSATSALREKTGNASAKLTEAQKAEVTSLVTENQALQVQAQLLEDIKGPAEQFAIQKAALDALYDEGRGKIGLSEYNAKLKELKESLLGIADESTQLKEAMGQALFNDASQALSDFVTQGKASFNDFARSVMNDIFNIIQKLLLMKALTALGVPGLTKTAGFQQGGSFTVGGHGGPDSQMVAFRASPGERVNVVPPAAAATGTASAAPAQNVRIVNSLDPHLMLSALSTTQGERIILNVISHNPATVRRALGG